VSADVARGLQLIQREGARPRRRTLVQAKPVEVDRSAADFGRRLALWLADVAVEAGRTPAVETTPQADRTVAL
jgi:hypothetical protein